MKKRDKFLLVFVVLFGLGCMIAPRLFVATLPKVNVTHLKQIEYLNYVSASGVIEQRNKQQIKSQFPLIVSEVLVDTGDKVKKGQPVIKVDRDQTAQKILETTSLATMADNSTENIMTSYKDIYDKVPAQVTSSFDGVIETVSVTTGDFVAQDSTIASMVSGEDLIVNIQVPENKISKVALGQKAKISGEGFEDGKYKGVVSSISPSARKAIVGNSQETVIDVLVKISNPDKKIKCGFSAKADIIINDPCKVSVVPYEALLQEVDGREYVYVVENGMTVKRYITTNKELSDGIEVKSGLTSNDYIVKDAEKVKKSGTLVKIAD